MIACSWVSAWPAASSASHAPRSQVARLRGLVAHAPTRDAQWNGACGTQARSRRPECHVPGTTGAPPRSQGGLWSRLAAYGHSVSRPRRASAGSVAPGGPVRRSSSCSSATSASSASLFAYPFHDAEVTVVDSSFMVDLGSYGCPFPPGKPDPPRTWGGRDRWGGTGRSHAHRRLDGQAADRPGKGRVATFPSWVTGGGARLSAAPRMWCRYDTEQLSVQMRPQCSARRDPDGSETRVSLR